MSDPIKPPAARQPEEALELVSQALSDGDLEAALAPSPDPRLRRLALATLVARAESATGWNAGRLARLRAFRNDPSPLVAASAQFTFPPDEGLNAREAREFSAGL